MSYKGKLVVFEGPDGSGKSALAARLRDHLKSKELDCDHLSFPGQEPGTLGNLVYKVHHEPEAFGICSIEPTSLQLLHIAAHIDAIERFILPALNQGRWIVLDRFWWSTWVYGVTSGANSRTLKKMIDLELEHWSGVRPACVFLSLGTESGKEKLSPEDFAKLSAAYRDLAAQQAKLYPVEILEGNGSLAEAWNKVVEVVGKMELDHRGSFQ